MQPLLVGLLVLGIVVVVLWLSVVQHRQALVQLAGLGERLGLRLVTAKKMFGMEEHHLAGSCQGREVRIWSYATGAGKSRRTWVAAGARLRGGGEVWFELRGQGMLTKLSEFFGAREITVGNPRFDEAWFVKTNVPVEFAAALLPEMQEKLMAARAAGAGGVFQREDDEVRYVEQGSFASAQDIAHLEAALPALLDLADAVEVCARSR